MKSTIQQLKETTQFITSKCQLKPSVGIVLGSGLGEFAQHIDVEAEFAFSELPNFVPPTVQGHGGRLLIGRIGAHNVAVLKGRVHYYEGHSMEQVVFPVRVLASLGVKTLFLTNAAGGLAPKMKAGDFMLISDHINLVGVNPLRGPNVDELGPRFPDMSTAYDPKLLKHCAKVMRARKVRFSTGVYCGVSGPTYETPAEIRFFSKIGASAVGMSTVPETIAAVHAGLKVAGISCITNLGAGISKTALSHAEVTDTSKKVEKAFGQFFSKIIETLPL